MVARRRDLNRAPCDIPGCRCTVDRGEHPAHWDRFICAKHYRLVSRAVKRVKARHEREYRRHGFYPREAAYHRICERMWREAGL